MSSFRDTTVRQLTSFINQKLYATTQDILGQVEKALVIALKEAKPTLNYHVLTPMTGTHAAVTGENLQQIMAKHPSTQEPHFGLIGEIVPKTCSEYNEEVICFVKEEKEEKETVSQMNVMSPFCEDIKQEMYHQRETELSDVLQCVYSGLYNSQ